MSCQAGLCCIVMKAKKLFCCQYPLRKHESHVTLDILCPSGIKRQGLECNQILTEHGLHMCTYLNPNQYIKALGSLENLCTNWAIFWNRSQEYTGDMKHLQIVAYQYHTETYQAIDPMDQQLG